MRGGGPQLPSLGDETVAGLRAELAAEASVANPVDMLGGATPQTAAALPLLLADTAIDAVIVLFVPAVSGTADEVAHAVERTAREAGADKPVLAVVMSSEGVRGRLRGSRHVATFAYPESAARALGRAAERAEWLRRPRGRPRSSAASTATLHTRSSSEPSRARTTSGSIRRRRVSYCSPMGYRSSPSGSRTRWTRRSQPRREVGFPVVVKIATPGAHKTETGGIALDLADEAAVRDAVGRIGTPVIVQPMI